MTFSLLPKIEVEPRALSANDSVMSVPFSDAAVRCDRGSDIDVFGSTEPVYTPKLMCASRVVQVRNNWHAFAVSAVPAINSPL